ADPALTPQACSTPADTAPLQCRLRMHAPGSMRTRQNRMQAPSRSSSHGSPGTALHVRPTLPHGTAACQVCTEYVQEPQRSKTRSRKTAKVRAFYDNYGK